MQTCSLAMLTLLALGWCLWISNCAPSSRISDVVHGGREHSLTRLSSFLLSHNRAFDPVPKRSNRYMMVAEVDRPTLLNLEDPDHNKGALGNESNVVPVMLLRCVYIPQAKDVQLNFIQSRMRRMCKTTKRFLVSFVPGDDSSQQHICSSIGVMLEIKNLNEELSSTKIVGVMDALPCPFRIKRVLNGFAHSDESNFIEAEVEPLQDDTKSDSPLALATDILTDLSEMELCYRALKLELPPMWDLSVAQKWFQEPSEDESFWSLVAWWQRVTEWTVGSALQAMREEISTYMYDYFDAENLPIQLPLNPKRDLPRKEYAHVQKIEARWQADLQMMGMNPNAPFQQIIETPGLKQRAQLLKEMTAFARNRLRAKYALKQLMA